MPNMPIPDLIAPYHTVMPSHSLTGSLNHIFLGAIQKCIKKSGNLNSSSIFLEARPSQTATLPGMGGF